jgi:PST family polysaccharide transporter
VATAHASGLLRRHSIETILYWTFSGAGPRLLFSRFDLPSVAERLRFGASMAAQSLLGTLMRQGDGLLVGFFAGPIAGGLYGQLQTLVVQPFAKLTLHVARAAFPTFAMTKDDPERLLRGLARMQRLVALSVFPTLVGMAAVAPRLLPLLLGPQYEGHLPLAIPAFQVLCAGALLFTYGYSTGVALNAIGLSGPMLARQAIGVIAVASLMLAGAEWGLVGLSVGRAVASGVVAVLFLSLSRSVLGFTWGHARRSVSDSVLAAIGCFGAAWSVGLLADWLLPASAQPGRLLWLMLGLQVVVGAAAYAAVLLLRGLRPRQEWAALRGGA